MYSGMGTLLAGANTQSQGSDTQTGKRGGTANRRRTKIKEKRNLATLPLTNTKWDANEPHHQLHGTSIFMLGKQDLPMGEVR